MVRRARGIIRCILNGLRSIVAGFVWRVEGGGGETTQDDGADRMGVVWDVVTCIAHQGVICNPPGINEMDPPLCGAVVISQTEVSETDH